LDVEEELFWQQLADIANSWTDKIHSSWPVHHDAIVQSHDSWFADMLFSRRPAFGDAEPDSHNYGPKHYAIIRFRQIKGLAQQTSILAAAMDEFMYAISVGLTLHDSPRALEHARFSPSLRGLFDFWRSLRLFVTVAGHGGLGPLCMRPGDVVVMISGCEHPVILRPGTDCHYYVGQAYFSAVSTSEIERVWDSEEEQLQRFFLR
jgi:hypothetical protein